MLFFAIFTIGYLAGVLTTLAVFPPRVKEIEEQEVDALAPILETKLKRESSRATSFGLPITIAGVDK